MYTTAAELGTKSTVMYYRNVMGNNRVNFSGANTYLVDHDVYLFAESL